MQRMPSIRSADDAPDVVSAIQCLFKRHLHTDFDLISKDGMERHHVHKLIVAIQSPVLKKLLYENNKTIDPFLHMKEGDNSALQNFVSYLYNEDLVLENLSDIKQTKAIADKYEVFQLSEICKEELINIPVGLTDVLSVLELAKDFKNEMKENDCLILISDNQEAIFTSRQFLGLPFSRVLDIFEKIKRMNKMTEALFLRFALRWLDTNAVTSKKQLLMEKVNVTAISLNDYLDIIIEYPAFFSNVEISCAVKEIKSSCPIQETLKTAEIKSFKEQGTNTEINKPVEAAVKTENDTGLNKVELLANVDFFKQELHTAVSIREDLEKKYDLLMIESESKNLEIDRQFKKIKELEQTVQKLQERNETPSPMSSISYASLENKQKHLSIQILNQEDGLNIFEFEKRGMPQLRKSDFYASKHARITIQDGSVIRSIQVAVDEVLRKGLIGTVAEKKGNYSEYDVDICYEGVYFMIRSLKHLDETLSSTQHIEVLKAALHFQLKEVAEKCIKRISGIVDYDPVFLDGLRSLSYLKDKCLGLKGLSEFEDKFTVLLLSEPLRVILHPNFTKCSVDLILVLLQQKELKVKDESQLLLVVIAWLEAQKEGRKLFRPTLLKNLAFTNISTADFRYAIINYPNFFSEKEQKLILAYRNAVGTEVKFFQDNLPEWYSSKTRRHI